MTEVLAQHRLGRRVDRVTVTPEGRRLLRIEARNAETPIERKPSWIKTTLRTGPEFTALKGLVAREGLNTVCEAAGCPNIYECWEDREATFLIGGDQCTRRCDFCQIDTGRPQPLDRDEPRRVAESVRTMQLRYATVTGVARDDLDDGGAWLYAETVRQIHAAQPGHGRRAADPRLQRAGPDLLAPVFETAPRGARAQHRDRAAHLPRIRPGFRYERSLDVISQARAAGLVTKSQSDPRAWARRSSEVDRGVADLPGCRLRLGHDHAVPAPVRAPPPRRALGAPRGVRRTRRRRPRTSDSPAC